MDFRKNEFHPFDQKDTIIALATPQGVGAIAVIRLSGPDAIKLTNEVFFGKTLKIQESPYDTFLELYEMAKRSLTKFWFRFSLLQNHLQKRIS